MICQIFRTIITCFLTCLVLKSMWEQLLRQHHLPWDRAIPHTSCYQFTSYVRHTSVIRTSYVHLTWNWRENEFQKPRPFFVIFDLKNITFRSCCCYLINKTCEKRIPTWFRMRLFIPTHIAMERIYPSLVRFAHSGVISYHSN